MSFVSYKLLGVDVSHEDSTAQHELGTRVLANDGKEYVYVAIDATGVTLGQAVKLAANYTVSASGTGWIYGVAHVALGANKYGWVQTKGVVNALIATSTAAGTLLGLLAASGSKFTAVVAVSESGSTAHTAGAQGVRAVALTAESSGKADVLLR